MKLILNNGNIIECSVQEYSELIGKGLVNSTNSSCGNSSITLTDCPISETKEACKPHAVCVLDNNNTKARIMHGRG